MACAWCKGFARAGHYRGRHFYGHNLPAAIDRELFKPSTDAVILLVSIKYFFDLGLVFSWRDLTKWGCFLIFNHLWLALGANAISNFFGSKLFWKLSDHRVYRPLDWPCSMSGTKMMVHFTAKSENCRKKWVSHWRHARIVIICCKNMTESYSNLRKTREAL